MEPNGTVTSVTKQVPFYVGDGNVVLFNASQSREIDGNVTYKLVIEASDNGTGAVTSVLSSVMVLRTLGPAAGVYVRIFIALTSYTVTIHDCLYFERCVI